ncbi:MAG: CobW family GTP-binding protein, partial [Gammaproteobacteria bacterium]
VMDAEQVFTAPEQMQLKLWQIAAADMLILNKVDLVSREQITKIKAWLDEHFQRYRLIEAERCDVPLEILLSGGRFDPARIVGQPSRLSSDRQDACPTLRCAEANCRDEHHGHDHTKTFSTWSYETDRPLSLEAVREAARKLPGNIYRCKGVIYTADAPERRAVLQVVGRRVDISMQEEWGNRAPRTQIVAIGAPGTLEGAALRERFAGCIVTPGRN